MISVILNVYKRREYFEKQLDSILSQTVKPTEILVWNNSGMPINNNLVDLEVISNKNIGVWSRFSLALNAKNKFISIIDDDTIPGRRWYENCLNCFNKKPAIYGARGIRFYFKNYYLPVEEFGIYGPSEKTNLVDIVGHNWFFLKEWLPYFWMESSISDFNFVGEDINLSYSIKKHLNIDTYVPPHPKNDTELWGSSVIDSINLGQMNVAISKNRQHLRDMNDTYKKYISEGLVLNKKGKDIIIGNFLLFKKLVGDLIRLRY